MYSKSMIRRTADVLIAIFNPNIKIKKEMQNATDITYDDITAVSAGFVIDIMILLASIISKEPRKEVIHSRVSKEILQGKYIEELLSKLRLYIAEFHSGYYLAIPQNISADNDELESIKLLLMYFERYDIAKLYINNIDSNKLSNNGRFNKELIDMYPNSKFRIYRIDKKRLNNIILDDLV